MGWLDKLFNNKTDGNRVAEPEKEVPPEATISSHPFAGLENQSFGHYSDNNKGYKKTQSWYAADDRFKEKNYPESFSAFFDYLKDDETENVRYRPDGKCFTFEILQGSKKIDGHCDGEHIVASAPLAKMPTPSTAVMRRLLELNFNLFYTRCALDNDNTLCMTFESYLSAANPLKLYHGLRELATRADKQDDLLLSDFSQLEPAGMDHIVPLTAEELEVKYTYFRNWIEKMLARVAELNQDSFSGAIAYMLLALIYRIDFLIVPQAKLLSDIEKISQLYWEKKEEITLIERNRMMQDAIRKLLEVTREEFAKSVYHSKSTFALASPPAMDKVRDNILNPNKDTTWYVENKYPDLALIINEYGLAYNQFIYSMPQIVTDLVTIYYAVIHADYFRALGIQQAFYTPETNTFNKTLITAAVDKTMVLYADKYTLARWDHSKIKYEGLFEFGISFTEQIANLNLEVKR